MSTRRHAPRNAAPVPMPHDDPTREAEHLPRNHDGVAPARNVATSLLGDLANVPTGRDMRAHFYHVHDALGRLRSSARGYGYMLVVFGPQGQLVTHRVLDLDGPPAKTIASLGRHTNVDLVLADDPGIALRAAIARVALRQAVPTLSLTDLNTGEGFDVLGAGPAESIETNGDAVVRIGAYTVYALRIGHDAPPWPSDAAETWVLLSEVQIEDLRPPAMQRPAPSSEHIFFAGARPRKPTLWHCPTCIALRKPVGTLTALASVVGLPPDTVAYFEARGSAELVRYALNDELLTRGVTLGRYDRCDIGYAGFRAPETLSRVHLFVFREGDTVWAFDVGTTRGTHVGGERTQLIRLVDGVALELGDGNLLTYRRTKTPAL